MQIMNTTLGYGLVSKMFHWGMAVLLAIAFILGVLSEHNDNSLLLNTHNWLGLVLLGMVLFRLSWRFIGIVPKTLPAPIWQICLARLVFILLYLMMFLAPISGYLLLNIEGDALSLLGATLPQILEARPDAEKLAHNLHGLSADLLLYVSMLHLLAALYHHYIRKDKTLRRMLPNL